MPAETEVSATGRRVDIREKRKGARRQARALPTQDRWQREKAHRTPHHVCETPSRNPDYPWGKLGERERMWGKIRSDRNAEHPPRKKKSCELHHLARAGLSGEERFAISRLWRARPTGKRCNAIKTGQPPDRLVTKRN